MEKIKSRLYSTVFIFTLLSIAFALISNGRQKDFYYIAIYLGIIGLFVERKNINLKKFNVAYPIILLGLIKLIWFFLLQHEPTGYNLYSDQFNGGKKLVLGGILVLYLTQCGYYLNTKNYKKIMLLVLGAGFLSASCYALWQFYHGMDRVEMAINRATISAYILSTLSIVLIYLLYIQEKVRYYILAAAVIIFSFIIIILTGTRAAIICHLLIAACMTFYYFKKIHFKSILVVLLISSVTVSVFYNHYIHPKIIQTYSEVSLYQEGKDNTSLGARFSMWAIGLKNFAHAPLGQSFKSRFDYSSQIVEKKPEYRTALNFISIHLHNEMIETLSLQGIAGGLALLWFYISLAWTAFKKRNTPLLFTIICTLVYGLSDVLLLSSEAILFYVAMIGICSISFINTQMSSKTKPG